MATMLLQCPTCEAWQVQCDWEKDGREHQLHHLEEALREHMEACTGEAKWRFHITGDRWDRG